MKTTQLDNVKHYVRRTDGAWLKVSEVDGPRWVRGSLTASGFSDAAQAARFARDAGETEFEIEPKVECIAQPMTREQIEELAAMTEDEALELHKVRHGGVHRRYEATAHSGGKRGPSRAVLVYVMNDGCQISI